VKPLLLLFGIVFLQTILFSSPLPDPWTRSHPPSLGLPGLNEPEVQEVIGEYYQPNRLPWIARVYTQSMALRTHIMDRLSFYQVPPELFFIPFIESEFNVIARSRSNAMGLWQFVDNSMAPWMVKNEFKDERLSFYQSTEAGILKLIDNYRVLGDWLLAAAAYNAGLGTLRRAMERTGLRDFWSLSRAGELPIETQRYIPKLLATAAVAQQLGRLGKVPQWVEPIHWTQIMVPGGTSLASIAQGTSTSTALLVFANRHLLQGTTPPNELFYPVTVPIPWARTMESYINFGH